MSTGTSAILGIQAPRIAGKAKQDSRDIAGDILRRQAQLEQERVNWDSYWQDVADLVTPRNSTFITKRPDGDRRTEKIFDSTAPLASDRFAAAFESMLTPRTQIWHALK